MSVLEKEVDYTTTNTYYTLNTLTAKTKTIWFVCHGMGYLSRYFLKYFKNLNPNENYIIAPQAPSKYYLPSKQQYVGGCWLTKERTAAENNNIMRYFDAIFKAENINTNTLPLIVLGFSQGVSVAMRYVAKRQIMCSKLIIHSGGIPKELTAEDFTFLNAEVTLIYGDDDEYITPELIKQQKQHAVNLFGKALKIVTFKGKHNMHTPFIERLV